MINYPNGKKSTFPQKNNENKINKTNYSSRGMSLEDKLNQTNDYYRQHKLAVIHKKPTPIQVVKVDYPKRSQAKIVEAYYRHASTTDYNGIYQGKYIDFEAKETKNKQSFPLANFPQHQRQHMIDCIEQGGISFLLIAFSSKNEIYVVPYESIDLFIKETNKQSIPYDYIQTHGYLCQQGIFPIIDYLAALDQYIEKRWRSY